jgi:hypothetical protein
MDDKDREAVEDAEVAARECDASKVIPLYAEAPDE